jgi:hypothetical protein
MFDGAAPAGSLGSYFNHRGEKSKVLRLVNHYEEIAHGEIKAAADRWGLSVYPKVRVADVVPIDELGVVGEMKRYGLQSHFDFVVCRGQWEPDYAVEFDGSYHGTAAQMARDAKKDRLWRWPAFRSCASTATI